MAQQGVLLDQDQLCCSVCQGLLKEPVTIPCGHSYCMSCIEGCWDQDVLKGVYSCPQCRETFTPRPTLRETKMLAELVEKLKKTGDEGHVSAAAERTEEQRSAQAAVEDSDQIFTELIRSIERRSSEVKELIRAQEKAQVSQAEGLLEQLKQEIAELRRRRTELEQLSRTEDHIHFLQTVSALRGKLEDFLKGEWTKISTTVNIVDVVLPPEPKTREQFLQHSCQLTLDPNTAGRLLSLSEGNRKVTCTEQDQRYPDHLDRFTYYCQVLCRECLPVRCYWEVEWTGEWVYTAVSYKDISRTETYGGFGDNNKSWSLKCSRGDNWFRHNNVETKVSGTQSSRVGVYLDHKAGTLSFYSVSHKMTLLHRVQTTFTQPLYPGFCLNGTAELVKL